jgi:hypothetical protein
MAGWNDGLSAAMAKNGGQSLSQAQLSDLVVNANSASYGSFFYDLTTFDGTTIVVPEHDVRLETGLPQGQSTPCHLLSVEHGRFRLSQVMMNSVRRLPFGLVQNLFHPRQFNISRNFRHRRLIPSK